MENNQKKEEWAKIILKRMVLCEDLAKLDLEIQELDTEENRDLLAEKEADIEKLKKQLEDLSEQEKGLSRQFLRSPSPIHHEVPTKPQNGGIFGATYQRGEPGIESGNIVDQKFSWSAKNDAFSPACPLNANNSFIQQRGVRPLKPSKFVKGDNFTRFAKRFAEHVLLGGLQDPNLHWYMLSFIECPTTYEKLSRVQLSPEEKSNISSLAKRYIAEIFPPSETRAMRTELLTLRQKSDEKIEDFCFRIDEIAGKSAYETDQVQDEISMQALFTGVSNPKIKEELLKGDHSNYQAAVKSALRMERVIAALKSTNQSEPDSESDVLPVFNIADRQPEQQARSENYSHSNNNHTHPRQFTGNSYPNTNNYSQGDQNRASGPHRNGSVGGYQNRGRGNYQVTRGGNEYHPSRGRQDYGNESRRGPVSCWHCSRNHYRRDCPDLVNAGRFQNNGRNNNNRNHLNGRWATRY